MVREPSRCQLLPAKGGFLPNSTKISQYLSGFIEAVLPGRGHCAETPFGAGAEPIAELRRYVAERTFNAQFQCSVQRPVRIVETFAPDRDQIGLPVSQDLLGLIAMDD